MHWNPSGRTTPTTYRRAGVVAEQTPQPMHGGEAELGAAGVQGRGQPQELEVIACDGLLQELESDDGIGALAQIAFESPRLVPRIRRLRRERQQLCRAVRAQRERDLGAEVDIAALAEQLRRYRTNEAALVYESVNVDLGAGD